MIYFLNCGLILEQETVNAIEKYFEITGTAEYFSNFTINETNAHPFARLSMVNPATAAAEAASLFPAVVVTTESDIKPPQLTHAIDWKMFALEPADIEAGEGGLSPVEKRYMMMTPDKMEQLRAAMETRENKLLYGISRFIRRQDTISIEIWSENPQLNNELYELLRLFVCGFMNDYLAQIYREYFNELGEGESPLVIFDNSVQGQRSNNHNFDFGVGLYGSRLSFEADYMIEQSIIDTEIKEQTDNFLLEVINHVKGIEGKTKSVSATRDDRDDRDGGKSGAMAGM